MRSGFPACSGRSLFRGIFFILIGTAFLLANLGWPLAALIKTWWPLIPIALGAANLLAYAWRGRRDGRPYNDFA
jgi:Domain of unknown function (DUF5668)